MLAWRILSDPQSLVACIYKARYFPDCSFWEATDHHSPSFSWRSIFGTREVLRENLIWQVGNGVDISIFSDRWIPEIGKPTCLSEAGLVVDKVSDLILQDGGWDEYKICSLFTRNEASAILRIPLSRRAVHDRMCWRLEVDGKFSVKSTYRYVFQNSSNYSPISQNVGRNFWKKLWKTKIPSKAKVHAWRLCLDVLPSMVSLVSKRVALESTLCVLCEVAGESTIHLCRDCAFTCQVIRANPVLDQLCHRWSGIHGSTLEWLNQCSIDLSYEKFGDLLFSLWSCWKERNERVWNQKSMRAVDVSTGIVVCLQEFRRHQIISSKPKQLGSCKWKAPPSGTWKINIDGAFDHLTRRGGASFVIRDSSGIMSAGGAAPLTALISAEHAELLACKMTIDFALEHGFYSGWLETDAQEVKRQLSDECMPNTTALGRLYEDVWSRMKEDGLWRVVHVNRKANTVAHLLAAFARSLESAEFYFSPPSFLQAAVAAELCSS